MSKFKVSMRRNPRQSTTTPDPTDAAIEYAATVANAAANVVEAIAELEATGPLHPLAVAIARFEQLQHRLETELCSVEQLDDAHREVSEARAYHDHQRLRELDPPAFNAADSRMARCLETIDRLRQEAS